ncbi:MAG: manganese efflux pump MntP [Thermoplasmata archaeon]|nr:MAG: manganese efflux pump MntP [Thermoplasmata archaeon]HHD16738.1 manganese efflux pump [Euryarchaeota archaeon]
MLFVYIAIIALSLAVDAFAASLSCGMTRARSKIFLGLKVGGYFGLFQALMFIGGWILGVLSKEVMSSFARWIAVVLLIAIGIRFIQEAIKSWRLNRECRLLSNRELIALSMATSVDALIVGISFGVFGAEIIFSTIIIGCVTFGLSFIGVIVGNRLRSHLDRWAEIVAGMVLIGIGIKILFFDIF